MMSLEITLTVNGNTHTASLEPSTALVDFLRDTLGYRGVKLCCNTGECGACTILMDGKPVNSCVVLGADGAGKNIVTVEGLQEDGELHPVQQAFIDTGAVQCGYCTPGMVMQTKALLARNPRPTEEQIRRGLEGNVCRCTGYHKIFDAVARAAQKEGT